jgi:hypothetical protein
MKRVLGGLGVLAAFGVLSATADAACTKTNAEVARVAIVPGGTATAATATISLRHPNSRSEASFTATSTNANVIAAALNAVHTRTKVTVTGDAATCPSTGSIGVVQTFTTD